MEPFERFSEQKLEYLRRRYRGDDLFRTWTRLLCILEQVAWVECCGSVERNRNGSPETVGNQEPS